MLPCEWLKWFNLYGLYLPLEYRRESCEHNADVHVGTNKIICGWCEYNDPVPQSWIAGRLVSLRDPLEHYHNMVEFFGDTWPMTEW